VLTEEGVAFSQGLAAGHSPRDRFGRWLNKIQDLANVPLPSSLTIGPAYGLIVLSDQPMAARFALFILSEQGLRRHGLDPTGLP
jgi:hypothetical protein